MEALLLSKQETARMLGLSIRTLEHLLSRREIVARRIGRRVLISRSSVETFAKANVSSDNAKAQSERHGPQPARATQCKVNSAVEHTIEKRARKQERVPDGTRESLTGSTPIC